MKRLGRIFLACALLAGCDEASSTSGSNGSNGSTTDGGGSNTSSDAGPTTCTLTANTTPSGVTSPSGCPVLIRDTSACEAERIAAGLSGFWLKFSCRVSLRKTTANGRSVVEATTDGQPDYLSNYQATSSPCWESYTDAIQNPNLISSQSEIIDFYTAPDTTESTVQGGIVGLTISGVPMFGNFAAPGDDIYRESTTFDRCAGHPQQTGVYHVHTEPFSITYDDSNFIGVMRDGHPVYGRRDADGSYPSLDTYGGHTGTTPDSPSTPVYHYHLSLQTSTNANTSGQTGWFLTGPSGKYRGTAAPCTSGCR